MKRLIVIFSLLLCASFSYAGEETVTLDHIKPNLNDKASLQNGAKVFTNYCFGCHELKYARYERVANDLGIPADIYEKNLIFNHAKIGSLMTNSMPKDEAKKWFGNPPPDLTLVARSRGADWLYSYLRGFYKDPARPWGVNNVVFKNVGMPHVLADLQGVCAQPPELGIKPKVDPLSGQIIKQSGCDKFARKGSMTPEEYNQNIYDLVNFLVYMGKPYQLESQRLGIYVLIFLAFLFVFAWFLNKEYWKDVH
jgi:ubiquinol-cytochrome c reductase cytochrome c1 subunit